MRAWSSLGSVLTLLRYALWYATIGSQILEEEYGVEFLQPTQVQMTWQLRFAVTLMRKVQERVQHDAAVIDSLADKAVIQVRDKWLREDAERTNAEFELEQEAVKKAEVDAIKMKSRFAAQPYFLYPIPLPLAHRYVYSSIRNMRKDWTQAKAVALAKKDNPYRLCQASLYTRQCMKLPCTTHG